MAEFVEDAEQEELPEDAEQEELPEDAEQVRKLLNFNQEHAKWGETQDRLWTIETKSKIEKRSSY